MDFACLEGFLKSFLCDYSDSKINLFLCVQSKNHYFITRIKSIFNSCVDFMTSNSCVVFEPFLGFVSLAAYGAAMEPKFHVQYFRYN